MEFINITQFALCMGNRSYNSVCTNVLHYVTGPADTQNTGLHYSLLYDCIVLFVVFLL